MNRLSIKLQPINITENIDGYKYNYYLYRSVLNHLSLINPSLSKHIHNKDGFKHFMLSSIENNSFTISSGDSSIMENMYKSFIFNNSISIKENVYHVEGIEPINSIVPETFVLESPVVVSKKTNKKYSTFISPLDEGYYFRIKHNLIKKLKEYNNVGIDIETKYDMKILDLPKKHIVNFKGNNVIGYTYSFTVETDCNILNDIGYFYGFGVRNNQGFGYCR